MPPVLDGSGWSDQNDLPGSPASRLAPLHPTRLHERRRGGALSRMRNLRLQEVKPLGQGHSAGIEARSG